MKRDRSNRQLASSMRIAFLRTTGELPASMLIVVEGLFHPEWLLEVEGIAAID